MVVPIDRGGCSASSSLDSPLDQTPILLPAALDRFVENEAPAVMTRLVMDWMIAGTSLDPLLESVSEGQYNREFLLSHFVQVMGDIACGFRKSPRAAFLKRDLGQVASLSAFYRKLGRMDLAVPSAIVRETAARARQLIVEVGGLRPEPIAGYATRILDGNVLAGTEHRIKELRPIRSAALPGMVLATYEPSSGLVLDVILEENAHTQERALLNRVPIEPGQLWIMDRNFCVRSFLLKIKRKGAFFLVRRHASALPFEPIGDLRPAGRCETGEIFEQRIWVDDPERKGERHSLRRIVLRLDHPTREGDVEIVLITNLPDSVSAEQCCNAYRERWQIEGHFQKLTVLLHCEIPTLGYPRAALFAFAMSTVAGNAAAVLKGSLRAVHGDEMVDAVSDYALINGVSDVYPGMMVAAPPSVWPVLDGRTAGRVAGLLCDFAAKVPLEKMLKSPRGPKKPRTAREKPGGKNHHVATKKILDASKRASRPGKK